MITEDLQIEKLKLDVKAFAETYVPSDEVAKHLKTVTIVPIIGPFAVGKTSLISEIISRYPDFGHAQGFTTRDKRPDEDPETYRFIKENKINLNKIINDVIERNFVQIATHPVSNAVYGTSIEDYQAPFTLIAAFSSSMDDINRTGFGIVKPVGLVAPLSHWKTRIEVRKGQIDSIEYKNRLVEAKQSLTWLLDQGPNFPWLVNADGQLGKTADNLVSIVRGGAAFDHGNRKVGEQLLAYLESAA